MQIKRALVVDDSKSARFSLKKLLQKKEVEADFAESAGDALNYLETKRPDVIFMDHLMPGMDGFEATDAIKGNPSTKDIPIVMCTSKEGSEYIEQAKARGAVAVLPKPAPLDVLEDILQLVASLPVTAATEAAPESGAQEVSGDFRQRAIENLVSSLIEEQLASIKRSAEESVESKIQAVLDVRLAGLTDGLKSDMAELIDHKLAESAGSHDEALGRVIDSRVSELRSTITSDMDSKINDFATNQTPSPVFVQEVKSIATRAASDSAADVARQSAEEVSRTIAQQAIISELNEAKNEMRSEFQGELQKVGAGKIFGIIGIVLGGVALAMTLM